MGGLFSRAAGVLLMGAPILASGCSLALVDGPPDFIPVDQPMPEGACTVERTLPSADAVGAGTFLFLAATSSDADRVRLGIILGGALGYSAYSGFRSVRQCRSRMLLKPTSPPSRDTTSIWFPGPLPPPAGATGESEPVNVRPATRGAGR